jgi:MoaA/NifB/PqqE/SkfB family radical SAM enzyme
MNECAVPSVADPRFNFDFTELAENGIYRIGELNPYITLGCDLRCDYCYMGDFLQTARNATELMTLPFLMGLIDTCIEQSDGLGLDRMTFLGGEPTLHPAITEMVNAAAGRDIAQLRMTTNAIGLHNLDLGRLKDGAFEQVSVSVDGVTDEENNATRGRGTFGKIIKTLREYVSAGVPINVNYTVTTQNVHNLLRVPEFFRELGASSINFHRASLNGTAYDNPELIVGPDVWVDARDELLEHLTCNEQDYPGMQFRVPYTFLTAAQMDALDYAPIQDNNYHCPDGGHRLIVLPPTAIGQGLCYMSSDLIGENGAELGKISPSGVFTWNTDPRNEMTVYRETGSSNPNISTLITGHDSADKNSIGLQRVSHSFKAVIGEMIRG